MKKGYEKIYDIKCDCCCGQRIRIVVCKPLLGSSVVDIGYMKKREKHPKVGVVLQENKSIKRLLKIMNTLERI